MVCHQEVSQIHKWSCSSFSANDVYQIAARRRSGGCKTSGAEECLYGGAWRHAVLDAGVPLLVHQEQGFGGRQEAQGEASEEAQGQGVEGNSLPQESCPAVDCLILD